MSRSRIKGLLHTAAWTIVAVVGLGIASVTGAAASPEDEIARLNRVRANLFEELVKTRAEAAAARAELDAAVRGREAAEAELARLKQEAASAKAVDPAPRPEAKAEPQKPAVRAAPGTAHRRTVRPAAPTATGSVQKAGAAADRPRVARSEPVRRAAVRPASRQPAAPVAQAQGLPSVLRLQGPQ
jgi:hypothetical protein